MQSAETYWSRYAEDFEARNNYVVGKSDIDLVLEKVTKQKGLKSTLELACGNGTYTKALALNATRVLATDLSDEMLTVASDRLKQFSNVALENANCFDLPYEDAAFDTVFMANLLHIIPEPEEALAEALRVLKPGGTIMIVSYSARHMKLPHKIGMIYRYLKTYGKPPCSGKKFSMETARRTVEVAGFDVLDSEIIGEKSNAIYIRAFRNE